MITQLTSLVAKLNVGGNGDVSNTTQVFLPTNKLDDAQLASILGTVYTWAGIIAVIIIVIAGFMYVTSSGDASKVKRAKDAILYAVIGLVVVILAFVITQFVLGRF